MTGLLRALASGALLLAATTTPSTLASTGDLPTTDDSIDSCVDEIDACQADDECLACIDADSASADQDTCADAWIAEVDAESMSESICAGLVGTLCCSAIGFGTDCLDNQAFVEWVACSVGDCAEDDTVCDEVLGGEGTTASDGDTSTVGTAAATLAVGGASTALIAFSCAFVVFFSML